MVDEFAKKMGVEDLVAVHVTKTFPENRIIKTANSHMPDITLRNTAHFTMNGPVRNISNGVTLNSWNNKSAYVIITPLDKLCSEAGNQIWNFNVCDTYFVGDTRIPRDSTIMVFADGYTKLIENGIVDRDTLMTKFNDERNPLTLDDKIQIEKEGIKYIICSWKIKDFREEVDKEIAAQGYVVRFCLKSREYWGAEAEDEKRIGRAIGAKFVEQHSGGEDGLHGLEGISHHLSNISEASFYGHQDILNYLNMPRNKDGALPKSDNFSWDQEEEQMMTIKGRAALETIPKLIRNIGQAREWLPHDFHPRIEKFLELNKKKLREFIPQTIAEQYGILI